MTRLSCPFCGPRELQEFRFHKTVAAGGAQTPFERVYLRRGDSRHSTEHWQHSGGCRAWLRVERDPSSGAVLAVQGLGGAQA